MSVPDSLILTAMKSCSEGISIADMSYDDQPLIYVNKAFEDITGYTSDEILGNNCRFLQGADYQKREIDIIREAINNAAPCEVTLRNYRKNGEAFWNRLTLSPVKNSNDQLTHFIAIQKDISREIQLVDNLKRMNKLYAKINDTLIEENITDVLTGLNNRRYLETAGNLLIANARREQWSLNTYLLDVDNFKNINDKYGHQCGDIGLQYIANCITEMFSREGDICIRLGGDEFLILTINHDNENAEQLAAELSYRIQRKKIKYDYQDIHFEASIGALSLIPTVDDNLDSIIAAADARMYKKNHLSTTEWKLK